MTEEKQMLNNENSYKDTSRVDDSSSCLGNKKYLFGFEAIPQGLGSTIGFNKCKFCGYTGSTSVETSWNVNNYLFCFFCTICWNARQIVLAKDKTLKDAVHKCGNCNEVIANYSAC